jgi:phage-related protein
MAVVNFPTGFSPQQDGFIPEVSYRTLETQFDDGYAQTASAGINNRDESVSLKYVVDLTGRNTLISYFDSLKGVDRIRLTLPQESTAKVWKFKGFSWKSITGNVPDAQKLYEIGFKIERTYDF